MKKYCKNLPIIKKKNQYFANSIEYSIKKNIIFTNIENYFKFELECNISLIFTR